MYANIAYIFLNIINSILLGGDYFIGTSILYSLSTLFQEKHLKYLITKESMH